MKKMGWLFLAFMLLGSIVHSATLGEDTTAVVAFTCFGQTKGSVTYALTAALSGTASTGIDMQNGPGIFFSVTATAGGGEVDFQTSGDNATWSTAYILRSGRDYCLTKRSRYCRFQSDRNNQPASLMTVYYILPVNSNVIEDPTTGTQANVISNGAGQNGLVVISSPAGGGATQAVSVVAGTNTSGTPVFVSNSTGAGFNILQNNLALTKSNYIYGQITDGTNAANVYQTNGGGIPTGGFGVAVKSEQQGYRYSTGGDNGFGVLLPNADTWADSQGVVENGSAMALWDKPTNSFILQRNISIFKPQVNISVGTTAASLWTPSASKKFRLMKLSLSTNTSGTYTFFDGATTITAMLLGASTTASTQDLGNGYLSTAANTVLTSTGPAGGILTGMLCGGEE